MVHFMYVFYSIPFHSVIFFALRSMSYFTYVTTLLTLFVSIFAQYHGNLDNHSVLKSVLVTNDSDQLLTANHDLLHQSGTSFSRDLQSDPDDISSLVSYDKIEYYSNAIKNYLTNVWNEFWADEKNDDFLADVDDNGEKNTTVSHRGHIIHKLKALIKFIIVGITLYAVVLLKLKAITVLIKSKFALVAFGYMILSAIRLFFDLKREKIPPKVIYYEHANHEHHYDSLGSHDSHHHGYDDDSAYKPSFWSRHIKDNDNDTYNYNSVKL